MRLLSQLANVGEYVVGEIGDKVAEGADEAVCGYHEIAADADPRRPGAPQLADGAVTDVGRGRPPIRGQRWKVPRPARSTRPRVAAVRLTRTVRPGPSARSAD